VLTINNRKGSFPGMLAERKFNIVIVTADKKIDKEVTYTGKKLTI
jgi:alpha-D-xyloside xylohydrolase